MSKPGHFTTLLVTVWAEIKRLYTNFIHAKDGDLEIEAENGNILILNDAIYIKAIGPDGDQYIYFYDGGSPTGAYIKWNDALQQFEFYPKIFVQNQMVFYQDGVLAILPGAGKPKTIVVPFNCTILEAYGHVETAPTGANIIVDVNLNGTSIWNVTPGNRLNIAIGATTGSRIVFDTANFNKDDELQIDVDQPGSVIPGTDLGVYIRIKPR